MDSFRQDLKYAIRALLHRPWFSVLAVLTLAVGIGVNAVAYSAINALLAQADAVSRGGTSWDGFRPPAAPAPITRHPFPTIATWRARTARSRRSSPRRGCP